MDKLVQCVHVHMYTLQEDSMVHVGREHSTRRRQRLGYSPQQCWRSGRYGEANPWKLQFLDTCRGTRCLDCRQCHTPCCDGPGESLAAVNS